MPQPSQIKKFDNAKHLAYGVVYAPNVPDCHGDFMTAAEIESMAHKFLAQGNVNEIDTHHDLTNNGSYVVESYIARKGDPDFPEGAWVMGVHIPSDDLWEQVVKGDIGGFSMYGEAMRTPCPIELNIPDDGMLWGTTLQNPDEDHVHTYIVKFDDEGNFLGGLTDEVQGHFHKITKGTTTEKAGESDHRHRFSFLEHLS